ncbi:MAG: dienelactone hydrolase [Syntrophorhabdales bacterium]|jgi:predicted dienelactone hydrolase
MNLLMNRRLFCMLVVILVLFAGRAPAAERASAPEREYDPLAVSDQNRIETLDFTVKDQGRQREIPIRVYLPSQKTPAPVVLFSHGLGGSRAGYAYLGRHWALRGYVAVFLEHRGSDAPVWRDKRPGQHMAPIRRTAGVQNFLLRVKDVPAVLDQLERWNKSDGHALAGMLDLSRIGMSGHSLGAGTTEAMSGQVFSHGKFSYSDLRIKAAIALSPSSPGRGSDPKEAFGSVKIPWMLMTGTRDFTGIGNGDLKSRLAVFTALPPGGKYELVLDGAEHSVFTDRTPPRETGKRKLDYHRVVLALSTAFWDAWLRGDMAARTWLDGDGPNSILEKNDRWQRK